MGASLPRNVTLAIRSPLPRSSETVLRWTSRAMLVRGARHWQEGAAGEGASSVDGALSTLTPPSSPPPPPLPPMLPTETKATKPSGSLQRLTETHSPASPRPSKLSAQHVCICVCVCVARLSAA